MKKLITWTVIERMSNSRLVNYSCLSPNNSGPRTQPISRITPHCVVGQASVEWMGEYFHQKSIKTAPNYGIGFDGQIGLYVPEAFRSWCSSSAHNDQRAVTIECASDATAPNRFNDAVYNTLIELCADICRRNGKTKLLWLGSKETTLAYKPKPEEMVLTVHRWFAKKACPGEWLMARMDKLAGAVTAKISTEMYRYYTVQKGDGLWGIAKKELGNGARYSEIMAMNGLQNFLIHPGQVLKMPLQ